MDSHENHELHFMTNTMQVIRWERTVCLTLEACECIGRNLTKGETIMWTKPEATEMRFGFEVTMYVCNR